MDNLSTEERDARTVFCMQLAARIRPRDLEEFFSAVGKVSIALYLKNLLGFPPPHPHCFDILFPTLFCRCVM